ncbi:MAG TPA: serine hydrolase [Chryseolinea sp.]
MVRTECRTDSYRTIFALIFITLSMSSGAQPATSEFLKKLLANERDSLLRHVLSNPETYRYQLIYTQINRDANNVASFVNYYYNCDSLKYFNPASTVKLPLALLTLEKLRQLEKYGVDMNTPVKIDSSYSGQTRMHRDSTSENGLPSMAHFIKKVLLISDNEAYNRMYEFLGQQTINRRLHAMGYPDLRITRRFVKMNEDQNRHTNAMRFVNKQDKVLYKQEAAYNAGAFNFSHVHKMGRAHYANDSLIYQPIDFTTANNVTVFHLQQILQSALFPEFADQKKRFGLGEADYAFLYRYLSQYPSETDYPKYDSTVYFDSYVKFFFNKGGRQIPPNIRVFNKVGWAYGCMTDVSYIVDFKNKVEFMLTLTLYVNSDGVMNDDKYDYETIGLSFFHKIGQVFYRYELNRRRDFAPDLSKFQMEYRKQSNDGRATIKEADN